MKVLYSVAVSIETRATSSEPVLYAAENCLMAIIE